MSEGPYIPTCGANSLPDVTFGPNGSVIVWKEGKPLSRENPNPDIITPFKNRFSVTLLNDKDKTMHVCLIQINIDSGVVLETYHGHFLSKVVSKHTIFTAEDTASNTVAIKCCKSADGCDFLLFLLVDNKKNIVGHKILSPF